MPRLAKRSWVPGPCENYVSEIAKTVAALDTGGIQTRLDDLIDQNLHIHERTCFNLNPAANIMNPRAEAALASGLGSRPSLGYPGNKYEMGLEAIEQIEVICAELAAQVFDADFVEIRVASGALANLYAFMATAGPGDAIIVPPGSIGGHVTHNQDGCAGLYGVEVHEAPIDPRTYSVDLAALERMIHDIRPVLITLGGSLNLTPHPVTEVRTLADTVGARVLFDAAHACGMIAGGVWANPLHQGAHLMTMSTYKSFGGPAGGLILSKDAELAERLDKIAFPGMTANFDAAKSAALAISLLDWIDYGDAYATRMRDLAVRLASELQHRGLPVFQTNKGPTTSHQFAVEATSFGGGQAAAKKLRQANILTSGIGLPIELVDDDVNGLRLGTPEIARIGMTEKHMPMLAQFIDDALRTDAPDAIAESVIDFRQEFQDLHFIRE